MANLESTMRYATAISGDHGTVVPSCVLIEMRRQRAERQARVAATIVGQAAMADR